MHKVDPTTTIQSIQAFHHIVRLTWPAHRAPSRRAISAAMVQNQASSAFLNGSVRRPVWRDANCEGRLQ
jgi:hypothetical protein